MIALVDGTRFGDSDFADDIVLLSDTSANVHSMTAAQELEATEVGVVVGAKK